MPSYYLKPSKMWGNTRRTDPRKNPVATHIRQLSTKQNSSRGSEAHEPFSSRPEGEGYGGGLRSRVGDLMGGSNATVSLI